MNEADQQECKRIEDELMKVIKTTTVSIAMTAIQLVMLAGFVSLKIPKKEMLKAFSDGYDDLIIEKMKRNDNI